MSIKAFQLNTTFHNTVLGEPLDKSGTAYIFTIKGPNLAWAKASFLESINASHFVITPDNLYWPMLYTRVVIVSAVENNLKATSIPAAGDITISLSKDQAPVKTRKPRAPNKPKKEAPSKGIKASGKRGR